MTRSTTPSPAATRLRAGGPSEASTGRTPWLALSIALVLALGSLTVHYPFTLDQSVFATFARMMQDGAVLYRDIWDPKQPGIFYYFQAAGRTFGYSEAGTNVFHLLWLTGGALVGAKFLERRLLRPPLSAAFPVLAVGYYYLLAGSGSLGQVEAVAGPLLVLYLVLAHPAMVGERSATRLFVAGFVAGTVGWFKLFLLAVPASMAVAAALTLMLRRKDGGARPFRYLGYQALGAAAGIGSLVVWAAVNGNLDLLWFTYVEYPLEIVQDLPLSRLRPLILRAITIGAPVAVFGVFALARAVRDDARRAYVAMALTWFAMAILVILPQTWHSYHVDALFFPAALLVTEGLDAVVERFGVRGGVIGVVAALILATPGVATLAGPLVAAQVNHAAGYGANRAALKSELNHWYAPTMEALEAIQPGEGDTIAALGNAGLVVYHSGLDQGIRLQPYQAERRIEDAIGEVDTMRPTWFLLPERGPDVPLSSYRELEEALERGYELAGTVELGTWYRRR
jgi:hypothetical protein